VTQPVSVAFDQAESRAAFTLHHPKGNIITADMVGALRWALESVAENPHLKLITIEGSGADFSFGASIPEHAPGEIDRVLPEMHALIYELLDARAPTAAIVRGRCFGGGFELALACDFIFAAETATFALPEIALGVFPPAASVLLPLRVGAAMAARAVLTGEVRTAAAWQDAGLVHATAPAEDLSTLVDEWFASSALSRGAAACRGRGPRDADGTRPRDAATTRTAILGRIDAHARRRRGDRGLHGEACSPLDGPLNPLTPVDQ
jgi:cyclohexa-1,5-dienecarbonyl-CoA hydratase